MSAAFLAAFDHSNYFCSTWMILSTLPDFFPFFIKTLLQGLVLLPKHVLILTNLHSITFCSSIIWCNLSRSSIVSVVPFSLATFRASLCPYLSRWILKLEDLVMVSSFRIVVFPFVLSNQELGPYPLYESVLHHYPPSVYN